MLPVIARDRFLDVKVDRQTAGVPLERRQSALRHVIGQNLMVAGCAKLEPVVWQKLIPVAVRAGRVGQFVLVGTVDSSRLREILKKVKAPT